MPTPLSETGGDPRELLTILDDTAATLRDKGKLAESVNVLWQALHLRIQISGRDTDDVKEHAREIVKFLNKLAVATIKEGDYDGCVAYLGKALKITEPGSVPDLDEFRILTLNNASCCHRRLGDTQMALRCAKDAIDLGYQSRDDKSLACSHLNACSVLSQAGRHEEALRHARDAVNAALQAIRSLKVDPELDGIEDEESQRSKQEQLATLSIAYHNAGVEFEHLGRKECLHLYRRALDIAEMHLPKKRKMSGKFRKSLQSAQRMMQRIHGSDSRDNDIDGQHTRRGMQRPKSARQLSRSAASSLPNLRRSEDESVSAPPMQISDQLREAREKVRELEQEMKTMGAIDDLDNGNRDMSPEEVRDELDELHERTRKALTSVKDIKRAQKHSLGRLAVSSSAPVLKPKTQHAESEDSLQIENAGMIVMGPGLMSGVGPNITGKGNSLGGSPTKAKRRKRRPASAPRGKTRKLKKLPPWAQSKRPDYESMPDESLTAIRLFHQLHLVLEKRRSRAIDIFREFDDDDSGSINKREFSSGCRSLGLRVTKAQRRAVFDLIDEDKSGDLDYMELGKEIKKAGKHPPPALPIDPEQVAAEAAAAKAKAAAIKLAKEKEKEKKRLARLKRTPVVKKIKGKVAGPAKLPIESLVKWCSGRLVSDISLRAYFKEHNGPVVACDTSGKSVLHALAQNKYIPKISDIITWFIRSQEAHKGLATVLDKDLRTPLHLLSSNPYASVETVKYIVDLNPAAVHMADKDGKTPLILAYELQCTVPDSNRVEKIVELLVKECAFSDRKLENNQLHSLLWAFSKESISAGCCLFLCNCLIKENSQLLRENNAHGVTPISMASSSFSSDIQKLFRTAERESAPTINTPEHSPKKNTKDKIASSPGPRKRRLKRWTSQPDFEKMKKENPVELLATRVFYALYLACDEKKMRPMDLFLKFDLDDSTTVDFSEFSKGVKAVGLSLSSRARKAVFSIVDKENTGQLDYLAVAKMIKKAGRYPPPPAQEGDSLEPPKSEKKKRKKKKKKQKIVMSTAQRAWNSVYKLMEHQRVKPIKLFHEIDESGDGTISPQELRDGLFKLLDLTFTDEDFKACLTICDNDHSGEISYREFAKSVKYGDPRRIASMAEKKRELQRLAARGLSNKKAQNESPKKTKSEKEKSTGNQGSSAGAALLDPAEPME